MVETLEPMSSAPRRITATVGVLLVSFLGSLEATVVSTAMPTIVEEIGGMGQYTWVFTVYMLFLTITGPLWGKLSDLYGRRSTWAACTVIFMVGSAFAGMSRSMEWLICSRIVQGIGAGGVVPLGQTTLADLYSTEERARVQVWIMLVYGIASAVGPSVGGYLAQHSNWRYVFYLNLPFGLVGLCLMLFTLPAALPHEKRPSLDWIGAGLFCAGFAVLLLVLNSMGQASDHWPWIAAGGVAVVGLLVAFLAWEHRTEEALIPLSLFHGRMFSAVTSYIAVAGGLLFGAVVYLPLFFEASFKLTPFQSGRALTPLLIGWLTTSAITARIALRIGYRACALIGSALFIVAYVGLFCATPAVPLWVVSGFALCVGLGAGFTMVPLLLGVQQVASKPMMGTVTSCVVFSRNLGAALGVALMGMHISALTGSDPRDFFSIHPELRAAMQAILHKAFGLALVVSLLSVAPACFVLAKHPAPDSHT